MARIAAFGLGILLLAATACGGESANSSGSEGGGGTSAGPTGGDGPRIGSGGTGGASTASTAMRKCSIPTDCALRSQSCCGACGAPSRSDVVALNVSELSRYAVDVCGTMSACPACAAMPDHTLLATCDQGQCIVVDLLDHPSTACSDASECYVRAPDCCECGGSTDANSVIALSSTSGFAYPALVCNPNQDCDACEPTYPNVIVGCIGGHCQVLK
jgi:hypothetical protein